VSDNVLTKEEKFLLRQFAEYKTPLKARAAYENEFGSPPTDLQLIRANIGFFEKGPRGIRNSARMQYFRKYREKWRNAVRQNTPLAIPEVRMERYSELFEIALAQARKTGDTNKCADILEKAAKEACGFYEKGNTINIDARSVNVLSDADLNKRINELVNAFGSHLSNQQPTNGQRYPQIEGRVEKMDEDAET